MTQEQIINSFTNYLEANNIKPTSKKALELQHAYINGLAIAMEVPAYLALCVMVGRSIITGK